MIGVYLSVIGFRKVLLPAHRFFLSDFFGTASGKHAAGSDGIPGDPLFPHRVPMPVRIGFVTE